MKMRIANWILAAVLVVLCLMQANTIDTLRATPCKPSAAVDPVFAPTSFMWIEPTGDFAPQRD